MNKLWYVRRNRQVKGPFPSAQVSRFVLLGRIRETDELSSDQKVWVPLPGLPELIPQAVRDGAGEEVLKSLRRGEDERGLGNGTQTFWSELSSSVSRIRPSKTKRDI